MSNYHAECAEWSDVCVCKRCNREYERNITHDRPLCHDCQRVDDEWRAQQKWFEEKR